MVRKYFSTKDIIYRMIENDISYSLTAEILNIGIDKVETLYLKEKKKIYEENNNKKIKKINGKVLSLVGDITFLISRNPELYNNPDYIINAIQKADLSKKDKYIAIKEINKFRQELKS